MGDTSKYKEEKQIALGILAHVDAGKTTLSESMLHKGGIVDNICLLYTSPSPRD